MSKGGSEVTVGYRYYMTLQLGLGRGPIDEIVEIKVGDKTAWPRLEGKTTNYDTTITDDRVTNIAAPSLFGGDKAEGGVSGSLTARMGKPTQVYPSWFKTLLGSDVPDFRGVATVIFDGLICAMNPYPKTWRFRLRRALKGWDGDVWQPDLAVISLSSDKIKAMNPAHILYECTTNREWGRGYSRSRINEATWLAAATTLKDEGFGLCMRWNRQDSLQAFVQEVLDHIGGTIYTNRETGLLDLKLIRGDYVVADLPLFTKTTGLISIEEPETASMVGAVGEVVVKYVDALTGQEQEVRVQNLAVLQSSEGTNSKSIPYSGIPIQSLAARVAQRDLKAMSTTAGRYRVKLDRRAWRIYPGAVFRVSDPDKGIENLILRAGKIDGGTLISGTITVEAVIDVFGLSESAFVSEEPPAWEPPPTTPIVITKRIVREITYQELATRLTPTELAAVEATAAGIATVAARDSQGMFKYSISSRVGAAEFTVNGSQSFAPVAQCVGLIDHYSTSISFDNAIDPGLIEVPMLVQIDNEIVEVTAIEINADGLSGTLTIARGCVDTIPAQHADNSLIFFISDNIGTDNREYASGEIVDVKLLSNTSSDSLDPSLAATDAVSTVGRQGRPYPPGNVHVNADLCFDAGPVTGDFTISWAHRDRVLQADQIVSHQDSSVGPEAGTTYNLRFYTSGMSLIRAVTGISGTSASFDSDDTDLTGSMIVRLESQRDGLTSVQRYEFPMTRTL
ncbi:putative tail assembly protein [Rhizobium phage RHph_X2_30]|nr:putative tail assembly protein [Rhizobium phage RHph_X2_30]